MSTNLEARAWIRVRADSVRDNLAQIRASVGRQVRVLPMVKADAYGLGVAHAIRALETEDPWGYGVATVAEGVELRALDVDRPVVVCSPVPQGQIPEAVRSDLQLSVSSVAALEAVARAATDVGRVAAIHVDVDTGMGRSGFDWREASGWLPRVEEVVGDGVEWIGCYTHLHSADESEASVREQWTRLNGVLAVLGSPPDGLLVHVLNSAGAFRTSEYAEALVRPGIFLYGGGIGEGQPVPHGVASLHARVVHVKEAPAGTTLGYGATHIADGPERWATLSVGYGDGLPRSLGNRGSALIHGVRVPIIGRISMDVTVVDITDVPNVTEGDVGTFLGSDGEETITVDEVACLAGTISYEILTGLTPRLPRIWSGFDA